MLVQLNDTILINTDQIVSVEHGLFIAPETTAGTLSPEIKTGGHAKG